MNALLACYIAGVERQSPFARVRRLPAKRSFGDKLIEATFLEFGKRTAGVSRVGLPGRAPGDYLLRCFMNIRMT